MQIYFSAPIEALDSKYKPTEIPSELISQLNGVSADREDLQLANYINDAPEVTKHINASEISGGTMSIHSVNGSLFMFVAYESRGALNESQLNALRSFTAEQFSDGGGNGFLQELWELQEPFDLRLEINYENTQSSQNAPQSI